MNGTLHILKTTTQMSLLSPLPPFQALTSSIKLSDTSFAHTAPSTTANSSWENSTELLISISSHTSDTGVQRCRLNMATRSSQFTSIAPWRRSLQGPKYTCCTVSSNSCKTYNTFVFRISSQKVFKQCFGALQEPSSWNEITICDHTDYIHDIMGGARVVEGKG